MCIQVKGEKKDPTFVPRDTRYFLHDDRYGEDTGDHIDEDSNSTSTAPVDHGRYNHIILLCATGNSITRYHSHPATV